MLDLSYRMAHKAVFHVELSSSLPSAQLLDMIQGLIHDYVWNEFGCAPEWPRFRGSCQMESPDKRVIIQTAFLKDEQSDEIRRILADLETYVTENSINMIFGSKPLSEYDSFVQNIKEMGGNSLEEIYKDAYAKYTSMNKEVTN